MQRVPGEWRRGEDDGEEKGNQDEDEGLLIRTRSLFVSRMNEIGILKGGPATAWRGRYISILSPQR